MKRPRKFGALTSWYIFKTFLSPFPSLVSAALSEPAFEGLDCRCFYLHLGGRRDNYLSLVSFFALMPHDIHIKLHILSLSQKPIAHKHTISFALSQKCCLDVIVCCLCVHLLNFRFACSSSRFLAEPGLRRYPHGVPWLLDEALSGAPACATMPSMQRLSSQPRGPGLPE